MKMHSICYKMVNLSHLYKSKQFSDIVLLLSDISIPAHQLILMNSSPFLETVLSKNTSGLSDKPTTELDFTMFNTNAVQLVITALYHTPEEGITYIPYDCNTSHIILQTYQFAEYLQIKSIINSLNKMRFYFQIADQFAQLLAYIGDRKYEPRWMDRCIDMWFSADNIKEFSVLTKSQITFILQYCKTSRGKFRQYGHLLVLYNMSRTNQNDFIDFSQNDEIMLYQLRFAAIWTIRAYIRGDPTLGDQYKSTVEEMQKIANIQNDNVAICNSILDRVNKAKLEGINYIQCESDYSEKTYLICRKCKI